MKKIFYWRFSRKIEGEFWIFYKRFPCKKNYMEEIFKVISFNNWSWVKIFQRISLLKIHTHASLARAVFNFIEWKVKWSVFGPLNFFKLRYETERHGPDRRQVRLSSRFWRKSDFWRYIEVCLENSPVNRPFFWVRKLKN